MSSTVYGVCHESPFEPPSDAALNYLAQHDLPVRWNIDQRNKPDQTVYFPCPSDSDLTAAYTIRAPREHDKRAVDVYYDVHPDELEQGLIGRSLEEDVIDGVTALQINTIAPPGKRKARVNMNLIMPGDPSAGRNTEPYRAHRVMKTVQLWNPDIGFELHNTPLQDDGMILLRRDVAPYVGRVAAYLSQVYDLPLVEAPQAMLSGSFNRSLLVEMPIGDSRFTVSTWRAFLARLVDNLIELPGTPATPQYSFRGDITRKAWLSTGQSTIPRPAFSLLSDAVAAQLGLPSGSRIVNCVGGLHPTPYAAVVPYSEH